MGMFMLSGLFRLNVSMYLSLGAISGDRLTTVRPIRRPFHSDEFSTSLRPDVFCRAGHFQYFVEVVDGLRFAGRAIVNQCSVVEGHRPNAGLSLGHFDHSRVVGNRQLILVELGSCHSAPIKPCRSGLGEYRDFEQIELHHFQFSSISASTYNSRMLRLNGLHFLRSFGC